MHNDGAADSPLSRNSPGFLDIQINGAYGFDFSVYPPPQDHSAQNDKTNSEDNADELYRAGLHMIAERIVETGVTSILPTIIVRFLDLYVSIP